MEACKGKEEAGAAQTPRQDLDAAEKDRFSRRQPVSPFQLQLQSQLTPSFGSGSDDPQSSAHPFSSMSPSASPICISQHRMKLTTTRPNVRGHLCRRRVFGKCITADDVFTPSMNGDAKRAKIEDYVDPFLLSEVAQKLRLSHFMQVNATRNLCHTQVESEVRKDGKNSFYWPSAELHAMVPSAPADWHWCQVDLESANGASRFDWPSEELHAMMVSSSSTSGGFKNVFYCEQLPTSS